MQQIGLTSNSVITWESLECLPYRSSDLDQRQAYINNTVIWKYINCDTQVMDYSGGRSIDDFTMLVEDQLHPREVIDENNDYSEVESST